MPSGSNDQDIYEEHVLDHYEDPYNRGPLSGATHIDQGDNPLCGDRVEMQIRVEDDKVAAAGFDGDGCVISQASASMLAEEIEGRTLDELQQFDAKAMLELFGPKLTPNRQKCCLLPWRVLQSAMHSPVDSDDDPSDNDESRGAGFGGPHLGDEA